MTKQDVLLVFAQASGYLKPDEVLKRLQTSLDRRSFYSYLLRLARQGLLEQKRTMSDRRIVYRITQRGIARLRYFRQR